MNKNIGYYILNPYAIYLAYKKAKLLRRFKDKNLSLGDEVSIHNTIFGNYVYLGNNVKITDSKIGNHTYVNSNTRINKSNIGKFCSIGPNVRIGMGIHPTNLISTHPAFYSNNKALKTFADRVYIKEYEIVNIENDVWIGGNVMIMDGVKIGNGAVIAAGAVVTKDVLPFSIVGGVPAKQIKFRFDEDTISIINKSKWWDLEEEWFEKNYNLFLDKLSFLEYFKTSDEKNSGKL